MNGKFILCSACGKGNFENFERCDHCNAPLKNRQADENGDLQKEKESTLTYRFRRLLNRRAS